jgi:hypothetical protein
VAGKPCVSWVAVDKPQPSFIQKALERD